MVDKGCRGFAWIYPRETCVDEELQSGAFAYTFDDPALDCYFPVKTITPVAHALGLSTETEKKYRRNTKSLSRSFACPKLVVRLIDDLSDITQQDHLTQTPHFKLLECNISGTKITETMDRQKPDAEVNASTTIQVQTECVHDTKAMETLVEPWKFDVHVKTSIEKETFFITFTAKDRLEFSITPDHIERPRFSMQKFDLYAKKQALYMKNALSTVIAEGFKQMETSIAIDQKVGLRSMLT